MTMDVSVEINGIDTVGYLINYEREDKICSGKGLFRVILSLTCYDTAFTDNDIKPWAALNLYENGVVVKQYNINTISKNIPDNTVEITAQDESKRLDEYFIPTSITTTYSTSTKYWMEHYLTEVGISYTFTATGYGNLLPNDNPLGMVTAYEQMVQLLQLSGWYMYFNASNVCVIGKLNADLSTPVAYFDKEDIITLHTHQDDTSLRNRAVVWGKGDPLTGDWVYADVSVITKWNHDENDKRTIVLSSPNVPNFSSAYSLAYKFLDEFTKITFFKEVTIQGAQDVELGDIVYLDTDIFSGTGMVTTCGTVMSKEGLVTKLILDERCPRLLGFYDFGGYVYAGTWGGGIKRKFLKELISWNTYNIGISDLYIKDLFMNNGVLSCVTKNGSAYISKEIVGTWGKISIPTLSGIEPEHLRARAVTQDRNTNNIRLVVDSADMDNFPDDTSNTIFSGGGYGWLLDITPNKTIQNIYPITFSGVTNTIVSSGIVCVDVENDYFKDYVSVIIPGSGTITIPEYYGFLPRVFVYHFGIDLSSDYYGPFPVDWFISIQITALDEPGFYFVNDDDRNGGVPLYSYPRITDYALKQTALLYYTGTWHDYNDVVDVDKRPRVNVAFAPEYKDPFPATFPTYKVDYTIEAGTDSINVATSRVDKWFLMDFETLDDVESENVIYIEFLNEVSGTNYTYDSSEWFPWDAFNTVAPSEYSVISTGGTGSFLLRRDGDVFTVINSGLYPQRLDCSRGYPLISMEHDLSSMDLIHNPIDINSYIVFPKGGIGGIISTEEVGDFRYYNVASGTNNYVTGNGTDNFKRNLLVTIEEEIKSASIDKLSPPLSIDNFTTIFATESGEKFHAIETSNFLSEHQYIFVATSGDDPKFYQQDEFPFREESTNLGSSPVICLRLDDRI
jgi:hypothetical protein